MLSFYFSAATLILFALAPRVTSDLYYNYHGCYNITSGTPNVNLGPNLGVNECMAQALSLGQLAFGLRTSTVASSQYCYIGTLSALSSGGNVIISNCDAVCPKDDYYPCGKKTGPGFFFALHSIICNDSNWSTWSSCSQTCDKGIRNRFKTVYNSTTCNSSSLFEYQSCSSGINCRELSSKTTNLKTICLSQNGYYAYSTCYFIGNTTTEKDTSDSVCSIEGAKSATLYAPDLVLQLGSAFLTSTDVHALVALQYTSTGMVWIEDGQRYPLLDSAINSTNGDCYALISHMTSSGTAPETPSLDSSDCSLSLARPLCMKTDHVYSSYEKNAGKKLIEQELLASMTVEFDAHACGARCSRLISCLGFNYNDNDQSCIPTKVSILTPTVIDGKQTYSIVEDEAWAFYDRT